MDRRTFIAASAAAVLTPSVPKAGGEGAIECDGCADFVILPVPGLGRTGFWTRMDEPVWVDLCTGKTLPVIHHG